MIPTRNLLRQCTAATTTAAAAASVITAAVPPNYSNIPYQKVPQPSPKNNNNNKNKSHHNNTCRLFPSLSPVAPVLGGHSHNNKKNNNTNKKENGSLLSAATTARPSPLRTNYIDRSRQQQIFNIDPHQALPSFRDSMCRSTDVSMRPLRFPKLLLRLGPALEANAHAAESAAALLHHHSEAANPLALRKTNYGEALPQLFCRWAAKFYGQVTYGPRNYPYPSSRWLARRFRMKKHRIIKRFRFRRYKLAAVANLPFAKMIRVGMLPELKSSKTKKGDAVDLGLSQQLVTAAKSSAAGAGGGAGGAGAAAGSRKMDGRRRRPKSKYQV